MNKKFSTLLAGAMLATAFSANALNSDIKLKEGANSGLYQLTAENLFLSITENQETKMMRSSWLSTLRLTWVVQCGV